MRVALVRGPQLNPFEMQSYSPLLRQGFELTAFASEAPFFEMPPGLKVERLPSPMDAISRSRGTIRRVREMIAYRRGSANRLEGLEEALDGYDVVHSAETFNAYTAQCADACARTGAALVVTVWENIPFLDVAPAFDAYRRRVLSEAQVFVAVTQRARQALILEGADDAKIHVVPVGVDLSRFARDESEGAAVRRAHGIPPDALLFLFAARLTWEKGLLEALHAMRLNDLEGSWAGASPHLLVVGEGDQREKAERRVAELGLAGRVHFVGSVPYTQMPAHYAAADAFVLGSVPTPRWQEQYGMVLVEAMASGLPVITAASGSIPEVVGDAALLVQAGDVWTLADAMAAMVDAKTRETYAARGLARAETRFDREQITEQLAGIYRGLS